MKRMRVDMWIVALVIAGGAAGCGVERYAMYDVRDGGDLTFFREGQVTGRLDPGWYKGAAHFTLYFEGADGSQPDVRDASIDVDWAAAGGRGGPVVRERCEAANLTCALPDPEGHPDDMGVEISFTLVDPGGSSRRITRRLALHRTGYWHPWILRDC